MKPNDETPKDFSPKRGRKIQSATDGPEDQPDANELGRSGERKEKAGLEKIAAMLTNRHMVLVYLGGAFWLGYGYATHRGEDELAELKRDNKVLTIQTNLDDVRIRAANTVRIQLERAFAEYGLPMPDVSHPPATLPANRDTDRFYQHALVLARPGIMSGAHMAEVMKEFRRALRNLPSDFDFRGKTVNDAGRGSICHALAKDMTGYMFQQVRFSIVPESDQTFEIHHTTNGIVSIYGLIDPVSAREIAPAPSDPRTIILYPKPFGTNTVLVKITLGGEITAFLEPLQLGAIKMTIKRRTPHYPTNENRCVWQKSHGQHGST